MDDSDWDRIGGPWADLHGPMYFDRQGQPISLRRWGELSEQGLDPDGSYGAQSYKRIGNDLVGEAQVSTVWLGMDHGFGDEPRPVIFETMIFGGDYDQAQNRYCTEAQAVEGHRAAVAALRAGKPPFGEIEDDD